MLKNLPAYVRECEFNPWVGKITWRRKWQSIPVFSPGKFHGQRSLVGYSPWGHKESDTTEWLHSLCLFLEEACCFSTNKSGVVKEAARNLTNRASRIHQHLSNSWKNWLSDWNQMPWVLPFLGPLLLLNPFLTFGPRLMSLFSKFLQDDLWAFTNWSIHELLLTHSNCQKLWPYTNPLDPHSRLFSSHLHDTPVPREAVTEDWPSALVPNQKGWMTGST